MGKKIQIDSYYDITCNHCGKSRSTDYQKGMETNPAMLRKLAYKEGWKYKEGMTLCPECIKNYNIAKWEPVEGANIPIDPNWPGFLGKTKEKYWVMTREGWVVYGYLYSNQYSESQLAVWCTEGEYYNNVTHWAPYGKPIKKDGESE